MKKSIFVVLIGCLISITGHAAEPLRVFIRGGEKTHGPGAHDHPAFLRDWTKLLNERGAKATGGTEFPTRAQLDQTDVLVLNSEEAGNIAGEQRADLEAFVKRGGGVVAVHAGTVSRDSDWYKTIIGGSWKFGQTKFLEGHESLYFTDHENPITLDCSNFDLDDEIYYDLDMQPEAKILAAAYTPKGKSNSNDDSKRVTIYDIQPQIWSYEKDNHRAFVCIPGHLYENFSHNSVRTILLRGIAWAGKRANADEFCKPDELGTALRYPVGGPTRPEKAAEKIEVHPDFNISLVASEPLINKAMNMDWDEKGRLWVAETPEYPNGLRKANTAEWKESGSVEPGKYDREPLDRISILSDTNGDGVMDKKKVFADKLELVTSFVFYKKGVIACSAPDIWFLEDTDGDDVCDKRTKLYTGLGTVDTHAVMNNLRWGLDGWVYATEGYSAGDVKALGAPEKPAVRIGSGVVRFKPDGSEIEMFASRGGNTWGLCMTSDGECFWTQPTSGTVFFHSLLPESVMAKGKIPGTDGFNGMITHQKTFPLMKWEQQAYVQIDLVGSYTAAAGCAIYEGGAWPDKWKYSYFVGEPTINIVSQYFVKPKGVTYTVEKEKGREETEFIRSKDLWFRPIEERVGPDGALYIIDFYNQAVIHNDTRGPQHGPAGAAVRPDRDHYFSRIWRIQHKDAKKIEVPVISKTDLKSMVSALKSPNAHTRQTAVRLIRESGQKVDGLPQSGSKAYQIYEQAELASTAPARSAVLAKFIAADDNWSKSALIAAASDHAFDFVNEALVSPDAAKLGDFVSALMGKALEQSPAQAAARLTINCSKAPAGSDPIKSIVLQEIARRPDSKPELTPELAAALTKLLGDAATSSQALPLISRWDSAGKMAAAIKSQVELLGTKLQSRSTDDAERKTAARSLVSVGSESALAQVIGILRSPDDSVPLQTAVITALGEGDHADLLVKSFGELRTALRSPAFDEILKKPEAALALLDAVEKGTVKAEAFGPGNIARLRTHPNKQVSTRANALLDRLNPAGKAKAEIIAKLTPEVVKPGNAENGKMMFTAVCAVCHRLGDIGTHDVGPPLTGMGSHGPAELLIHIVDPNREVDPSFWQWNITTKKGETFAGAITNENGSTVTLRSQGGDSEIRKEDIATRENTNRSLMPEGLDALGPEILRDILTFICGGDSRYRVLDLRDAYTADSRRGLFAKEDAKGDSVFAAKFGNISTESLPFFLMDPAKSPNGLDLIVLKGGGRGNVATTYPKRVEIPAAIDATRFYLLSGIAGWGYPATADKRPAMKVIVTHADGQTEETELLNGVAFGDYNRETELPGSKLLKGLVNRGQLRLITVEVKKPGAVKSIALESYDNGVTPVVVAITADLSKDAAPVGTTSNAAPQADPNNPQTTSSVGEKFAEPKAAGKLRVLLAGAGSSHDFPKYFLHEDSEILKGTGVMDIAATPNVDEAIALLAKADVVVFSGNDGQYAKPEFQKALNDFADAGKGIVVLHAATWYNWPATTGYNKRFVAGGTRGHGKGEFETSIKNANHPVTAGVSPKFKIIDESYQMVLDDNANVEVLAENFADQAVRPSVWVVKDPKTKIVCITLGHAAEAHGNPDFRKLLINSVKWVGSK